jgi:hypothetical protein
VRRLDFILCANAILLFYPAVSHHNRTYSRQNRDYSRHTVTPNMNHTKRQKTKTKKTQTKKQKRRVKTRFTFVLVEKVINVGRQL